MLKRRHVGLPEVAHGYISKVGGVAGVFRTAVYGIVLGTGPELAVLGVLGTLQAANDGIAHH